MPPRQGPPRPAPPSKHKPGYSAEEARGGEIVLRTRTRRVTFILGLVGAVVLALLIAVLAGLR